MLTSINLVLDGYVAHALHSDIQLGSSFANASSKFAASFVTKLEILGDEQRAILLKVLGISIF